MTDAIEHGGTWTDTWFTARLIVIPKHWSEKYLASKYKYSMIQSYVENDQKTNRGGGPVPEASAYWNSLEKLNAQ